MPDSSVSVRFSADISQLRESIDTARESLDGLGESFRSLAELAGISLGAEGLKEWVLGTTEAAEQLQRMSAMLGTSVPQVSELSAVAKLSGTDFAGLATAMERLQLRLTTTGREGSAVAKALEAMQINARQFAGLSIPEQMDRLAIAAQHFADSATKTAAFEALGRNFVELLPLLDRGKQGMDELREAAQASGAVMSSETAEAFARTKEDISNLSLAATGFSNRLYAQVNPAIDATVKYLTRMLEAADPGSLGSKLTEFASDIARSAKDIADFCQSAIGWLEKLYGWGEKLADMLNKVQAASEALGAGLRAGKLPFEPNLPFENAATAPSASPTGGAAFDHAKVLGDIFETDLTPNAKAAADALKRIGGGGDITVSAGSKPNVPAFQTGGGGRGRNQAFQDAQAEAGLEVEAQKAAARQIEDTLNEQLKTHQITMASWLSQTKDALQDEYQYVQSTYEKELQTAGLTSAQILNIKRKEATELAAIAHQVQQAQTKAAEASEADWQKVSSAITGAVNSQIHGLLAGTENFATAAKNVLAQLTERFITFGTDIALNFALNMSGMKAAVTAFNAALGPLMAVGSTTSAAAMKPGAIAAISGPDAGEMLAGFVAFFAPTLGPGAFAAAQGLTAAATAQAIGLASAATGGFVISGGLANIHAGETIVPAQMSQPFQGVAGRTVNFNVQAIDQQSVYSLFARNGDILAKIVSRTLDNNPSLRPSY
jgi:hypothetical protein